MDPTTDNSTFAPSPDEYLACQISSWYPQFSAAATSRQKGLTFRTSILEVPAAFLTFLQQDGVQLPPGVEPSSCLACTTPKQEHDQDSWSDDSSQSGHEDEDGNDDTNNNNTSLILKDPELKELTDRIASAIQELQGAVIPKLNWSAPKDATWINEGTLKSQTAGDVYLLLKSSDFCSSDVELISSLSTTSTTAKVQLSLRKWANLFPSMEFRCFVRDHALVGVSQRHADQHFEHLTQQTETILDLLHDFFDDHVVHKFANNAFANYVMDVYVDRQDRVWIVDFNVWGERTDSLLYSWEELRRVPLQNTECEIRIVETEKEVRPHSLNNFRAPVDTVHIASITNGNSQGFQAFMDLCRTQKNEESSHNNGNDNDNARNDIMDE